MFSMLTACPGARQLHSMEPSVPRTAQTAHWELHSTHGCKGSKNPSEKKPKSQGKRIMVGNNVKKSPDVRGTLELELWKGKALEWTEFMSLGMRAETSATPANCPLGWQELVTDPITLISIPHTKPLMCTWVHQPQGLWIMDIWVTAGELEFYRLFGTRHHLVWEAKQVGSDSTVCVFICMRTRERHRGRQRANSDPVWAVWACWGSSKYQERGQMISSFPFFLSLNLTDCSVWLIKFEFLGLMVLTT